MSAEPSESTHHSLLTAKGFRFEVHRRKRGEPWNIVVGDQTVGYMEQGGVKSWQGIEIYVRGATATLYGLVV